MTISATQADSFYAEALANSEVWTIQDAEGIPSPMNAEGVRAMPFWSLSSRAETVVENVAAYSGFAVVAVPLSEWRSRWLPGLTDDGMLAGLNWSGDAATGYDADPEDVERNLDAHEYS